MRVPRFDPVAEDAPIQDSIRERMEEVCNDGRFIDGPWVQDLEARLHRRFGRAAVCVASGTDALTLALMAAIDAPGVRPRWRARVAVPALTFSATASAVIRAGMEPVIVDVDENGALDWNAVANITDLEAVIPVHLYGRPCRAVDTEIVVIEDACQAFGSSEVGTEAELVTYSFFPTKPFGCYGDGGAVVGDAPLVRRIRRLARHGCVTRYHSEEAGLNSRLDSLQAAVLLEKLGRVEETQRRRAEIARRYSEELTALGRSWIRVPADAEGHTWHIYALRCEKGRDLVRDHLMSHGVDVAVQYPALHHQRAFARYAVGDLPHATRMASEVLSLPIWSGMTDEQVSYVIECVAKIRL